MSISPMVARKPNGYPFHSSAGAVNQVGSMPVSSTSLTLDEKRRTPVEGFYIHIISQGFKDVRR